MCAYLRLDSVEEKIEGDANLHHPVHNRVKSLEQGSERCCFAFVCVVRSGYIWTEFEALHHQEFEVSGQTPLKLIYLIKGFIKKRLGVDTLDENQMSRKRQNYMSVKR